MKRKMQKLLKVMFSVVSVNLFGGYISFFFRNFFSCARVHVFTGVCLSTIGLVDTGSLLGHVTARLVRILLECFLVFMYLAPLFGSASDNGDTMTMVKQKYNDILFKLLIDGIRFHQTCGSLCTMLM